MKIDHNRAAKLLANMDNIFIITHHYPDGDTLGSGFALCRGLRQMGKKANVICSHEMPGKYDYMWENLPALSFTPENFVAVDTADTQLFGEALSKYADKVQLCIDHHGSNTLYAADTLLDVNAAATAEIIFSLLKIMDLPIDVLTANCLYTGIATDTGCFKYSNTTAKTHLIAAELINLGADKDMINRLMFETKTRARIEIERLALNNMEFYLDGKCALMYISREMIENSGVNEGDLEGLSPLPREIEGVAVGITIREKENSQYKISIRTGPELNAAELCSLFGGGGHPRASGCSLKGSLKSVKEALISAVEQNLGA